MVAIETSAAAETFAELDPWSEALARMVEVGEVGADLTSADEQQVWRNWQSEADSEFEIWQRQQEEDQPVTGQQLLHPDHLPVDPDPSAPKPHPSLAAGEAAAEQRRQIRVQQLRDAGLTLKEATEAEALLPQLARGPKGAKVVDQITAELARLQAKAAAVEIDRRLRAGSAGVTDSWQPVDLAEVLAGAATPVEAGLMFRSDGSGLLYAGKVSTLNGESESGKSMVAQYVAAEVLKTGQRVVYLDFESDAQTVIVERLLRMGVTADQVVHHLVYVRPDGPVGGAAWDAVLAEPATLAVIDGVGESIGMEGLSVNDNDEVTSWGRRIPRAISEATGAAVLLVDHVVKSAASQGRFAIGAQAKMSILSGVAYTVKVDQPIGKGKVGRLELWVAKDRPGSVRPLGVRWTKTDRLALVAEVVVDSTNVDGSIDVQVVPPEGAADPSPAEVSSVVLHGTMQAVSELLQLHHGGLSKSKIEAEVKAAKSTVAAALQALRDGGYVVEKAGPHGAKVQHSVVPYVGLFTLADASV